MFSTLKKSLFGTREPARPASPPASPASSQPARAMRIAELIRETDDALTVVLEPVEGTVPPFVSGQFLNLQLELPDGPIWRAYSLCRAPHSGELAVTVKRIEGGKGSSYLHQQAKVGQVLQVRGPSGTFVLPAPSGARHVLLIAGGSGITPMMSHTHHLLSHEPESRVTLLYGNRGERDIIFRTALDQLREQHATRLVLRHVLSEPSVTLEAGLGMLDTETALRELRSLGVEQAPPALALLCGPTPMMSSTREALLALGLRPEQIIEERFTAAPSSLDASKQSEQRVTARIGGQETTFAVEPGETILEASQRTRLTLDFSCATGDCGTCAMRMTAGSVKMEEPNCLTEAELEKGVILPCISRPLSACTIEPQT